MRHFQSFKEEFIREMGELDKLILYLERQLKEAPGGTLRITHNKGNTFYYRRSDPKDTCGCYIQKKDISMICALAQKEYNRKLLHAARERRKTMEIFLKSNSVDKMENLYINMSEDRKKLITPYILPDKEFIQLWQQQTYIGKSFAEDGTEIYTERGERVRSKSEKILADKFYLSGIPYRYEYPLKLNGMGTVYPDFTLLNCRTRKEYYWEHFGLKSDPEYCEKAVKKLSVYEKNKIFPGEKLIVTYETGKEVLDMKLVDELIDRYLR